MSGSWTVEDLEEIFLSHEFAGGGASRGRLEPADGHQFHLFHQFHGDPDESRRDMNEPLATVLAFAPRTPAGRQRVIAAIGGVAAAVLVVVGVTSGPHGSGPGHRSEALARAAHRGNPMLPPADAPPSGIGVTTGVPGLLAAYDAHHGGTGGSSASAVRGSFSIFNGAATGATSSSGAAGLPSGGTSVAPSLPSPSSTIATNPMTQLTSNVGGTLSTTAQQISEVLPAAMPINEVVNNVASTVGGLTGTLAAPNT